MKKLFLIDIIKNSYQLFWNWLIQMPLNKILWVLKPLIILLTMQLLKSKRVLGNKKRKKNLWCQVLLIVILLKLMEFQKIITIHLIVNKKLMIMIINLNLKLKKCMHLIIFLWYLLLNKINRDDLFKVFNWIMKKKNFWKNIIIIE